MSKAPQMDMGARLSAIGHAANMTQGGDEGGGGGGGGDQHLSIGEQNYLMGLLDYSAQSSFVRIMTMGLSTICSAAPYILGGQLESIGHSLLSMLPPTSTPGLALPKPVLFSQRGR